VTTRRVAVLVLAAVLATIGHGVCEAQTLPGGTLLADAEDASSRQLLLMLSAAPSHYRPEASYGGSYQGGPGRVARRRLADDLAHAQGLSLRDDYAMPALGLDCFVLEAPSTEALNRAIVVLKSDPRVESVERVQVFHSLSQGDPFAAAQTAVSNWHLRDLHALTTGRRVRIAILDSGADIGHPDLRGQRVSIRNFVGNSRYAAETHGTAVAGIIAAQADDGIGIAGIAPQSNVLALRACEQTKRAGTICNTFSLAKALQFALTAKAQVVNLSLTGPSDPLIARLLDVALRRGTSVVSAIDPGSESGGFPAAYPGVLAVAGMRDSPPSSLNALRVPDRGIPAPRPGGGWDMVSGSSFASAQVSGLIALMLQLSPQLTQSDMRSALSGPTGLGLTSKRPRSVDACAAVTRVARRCACGCAVLQSGVVPPRQ
jgi:hypothetical protein